MEEVELKPGEEWSGEIPEPASDEISEPPIPDEPKPEPTPKPEPSPEPTPEPTPTPVVKPVYSTPAPAATTEPSTESPKVESEKAETTKNKNPKETNLSPAEAPESYLSVEVPSTATYTERSSKITTLSFISTGIVVFSVIFVSALIAIKKLPKKKVNPLV